MILIKCPVCGGNANEYAEGRYAYVEEAMDNGHVAYHIDSTKHRISHVAGRGCGCGVFVRTGRYYMYKHKILLSMEDL